MPSITSGIFQSTLPAWGETVPAFLHDGLEWISIHSPRMGRDEKGVGRMGHELEFQSTLPAWGETRLGWLSLAGAYYFNPLSPHGERRSHSPPAPIWTCNFNPLSPHGERQDRLALMQRRKDFNPLSPHGERHAAALPVIPISFYFNPLSPHGERRGMALGSTRSM